MDISTATNWVKDPNKRSNILLVALIIAALMWYRTAQDKRAIKQEAEKQLLIHEQNVRALNDTIRLEKTKSGEIEAVKSSFVSKLEDLEKLNRDLYAEVKNEVGKVKGLIKGMAVADAGEVVMSNQLVKYPDGKTFGLSFQDAKADTGFAWTIKGESKFSYENGIIYPGQTTISENQMKLRIIMGFKESKDGNYEVFARSGSEHVVFDKLDGVLIIPKKADPLLTPTTKRKKFGLGPQVGFGIGSDLTGKLKVGPYIGFGVTYNIISF